MYCQSCGQRLEDEDRFCPACGSPAAADDAGNAAGDTAQAPATPGSPSPADAAAAGGAPAAAAAPVPATAGPDPATAAAPVRQAPRRKGNGAAIAAVACAACALVAAGAWFFVTDPADVFGHGPRAQAEQAEQQAAQEEADRLAREEEIRADERKKAEDEAARKEAEEDAAAAAQAQREAEAKQKAAEQKQREAEAKQKAAEAEADELREAAAQRDAAIQRSASSGSSAFILPQSSSRVYTDAELSSLSDQQLFFARNEIFARYGRKFKEAELDTYFRAQSWYRPTYEGEVFDAMPDPLTEAEKANCKKMLEIEKARNSKYVQAPYV